ncbi:MAG: cyclic nucleotide-binding domain-containing protein [Hyphomicrobiales bacterium]|nr:cyclic nucleotide-binding domain-containing protein [Hyphomicrobiales bacterium]
MSIDDDVALLERVPTLRLLGRDALRVIAIGSEQQDFSRGSVLFREDELADCGYVVQSGAFIISVDDGSGFEMTAERGALIGELSLLVAMPRRATAVAAEYSSVIRITRILFQRVLDSDPDAAVRLRNDMATRMNELASDFMAVKAKLG